MPRLRDQDVGVLFGRKAGVGLLDSVFMGGKRCRLKITLLEAMKEEHV
ncbi:MAG: hypothetical protein OEW05_01740 [Candidatus Aminicenantes bacterium]|nr:hypothetical protein [Candidatus Aminicenantes bacterium]